MESAAATQSEKAVISHHFSSTGAKSRLCLALLLNFVFVFLRLVCYHFSPSLLVLVYLHKLLGILRRKIV